MNAIFSEFSHARLDSRVSVLKIMNIVKYYPIHPLFSLMQDKLIFIVSIEEVSVEEVSIEIRLFMLGIMNSKCF